MSSSPAPSNADYAAILLSKSSTTSDANTIKPTIFDIMAQENMQSLFGDSFNHVFSWLAQYFKVFSRLKRFKHEIYVLLHSALEFVYLKNYDCLFSEHFYGLKRHGLRSSSVKRALSVVFSIVVPYLKSKLDGIYEDLEKSKDLLDVRKSNDAASIWLKLAKIMYLNFYPYFHLAWSLVFWLYRFRFMFKASDYNSPFLHILSLKLVYSVDDTSPVPKNRLLFLLNKCFTSLLFFLQFFKWYEQYTENESYLSTLSTTSTIKGLLQQIYPDSVEATTHVLEAPILSEKLSNNRTFQNWRNNSLCPLCNKRRTNDCVLTVSGFVFCYPCIFKFIKEHSRCPITNYPCTTRNLVRLYASQD